MHSWLSLPCVSAPFPGQSGGREPTTFLSVLQTLLTHPHSALSPLPEMKRAPQGRGGESHDPSRSHLTAFYDMKYRYVGLGKRQMDYRNLDIGLGKRRMDRMNFNVGLGKRRLRKRWHDSGSFKTELVTQQLGNTHFNVLPVCVYVCVCVRCLLYTSPSPRDIRTSRMPSSA